MLTLEADVLADDRQKSRLLAVQTDFLVNRIVERIADLFREATRSDRGLESAAANDADVAKRAGFFRPVTPLQFLER